jgi:hypothetical protein
VQGVMASAGGVSWGCFLTVMLPLRRRGWLGRVGNANQAVSGRDERPVVEAAADVIQPNCRHYAAVAIIKAGCPQRARSATAIRSTATLKLDGCTTDGRGTCTFAHAAPSSDLSTILGLI